MGACGQCFQSRGGVVAGFDDVQMKDPEYGRKGMRQVLDTVMKWVWPD